MMKRFFGWFLGLAAAGYFTLCGVGVGEAAGQASLFVGPNSGTFTVGSTFTVSIYLNTGGQAVNAIEANLTFPPDKLQVVSPTTGKSLVQIWVSQPTYSNTEGTLKFQGTIPTPGINTESGLISTVTFRVKSTGAAIVKISDTSRVLLNDGKGTDFLGQRTNGIYNLILPPPAGPIVTSPTHPDQQAWSAVKTASFNWVLAPGVQGFSYVLSDVPSDVPDEISEGTKTGVTYKNLADGIHYFHIKSLREGVWGGVTSYAINVDGSPPAAFAVDFSPGERTSNRNPIISFETTDETSGVDHYELKIIPLSHYEDTTVVSGGEDTPFFIEANSPYNRRLELGKYDVVVRAYDEAGNFFQATGRLNITKTIFEIVRGEGVSLRGNFVVPWFWVWVVLLIAFALLLHFGRKVWIWHRGVEKQLEIGALGHPDLAPKIQMLKDKQKEYGKTGGLLPMLLLFILPVWIFSFGVITGKAAGVALPVEPPVVSLFPTSISNDDILYIGGRSVAPEAEVIIYIQNEETGLSISQTVKTDGEGEWFYSFPQFFDSGEYSVWTQLKIGEQESPPSSKLELTVAPTAIQIGSDRISYEQFYLIALVLIGLLFFGALIFIAYHSYHHQAKSRRLRALIREVEESVKRGFVTLRRDVEAELGLIRKAKMDKELAAEEKLREEKLLKDLEAIDSYIGKEMWDIEKEAEGGSF